MRLLVLLIILLSSLSPLYSQVEKPIVFIGKIKSYIELGYVSIDVKILQVINNDFDHLDPSCDSLIRIEDIRYASVGELNNRSLFYLEEDNERIKLDERGTYLFFLKDSIVELNELRQDTSHKAGFNYKESIHVCDYPGYHQFSRIFNFDTLLARANEIYYNHQGTQSDTILIDLRDRLLPDGELEFSFNTKSKGDKFEIVATNQSLGTESIIFSSDARSFSTNGRIPLSSIHNGIISLRVFTKSKKSKWTVQYNVFCKWLEML